MGIGGSGGGLEVSTPKSTGLRRKKRARRRRFFLFYGRPMWFCNVIPSNSGAELIGNQLRNYLVVASKSQKFPACGGL